MLLTLLALIPSAEAFCGFYVAKADTSLFNDASQVVLARDDDKTVITMANDYRGPLEDFAMVIPVPTAIERSQIHVAERGLIDHLDAYTSPRLVEYHDPDPCRPPMPKSSALRSMVAEDGMGMAGVEVKRKAKDLGVTIEATYTVGEYDIVILSAKESDGLETWLRQERYRIPHGAARVLDGYIKQDMRFFVAKVNLGEQARTGRQNLRPIQVAYESPKFMLPIRLGMLNADGQQELFVYTLTRTGRVETTNYRNTKLPTGMDIPVYIKDDFGRFYTDMFSHQVQKENGRAVFTEYAWDMAWCDPCAADPLSAEQLRNLGVFWAGQGGMRGPAQDVYVTRLHLRYDNSTFPEDLVFQETGDRQNFQGRYVLRHPFTGNLTCPAGQQYEQQLGERQEREVESLASLTGWSVGSIRARMGLRGPTVEDKPWWERLWE